MSLNPKLSTIKFSSPAKKEYDTNAVYNNSYGARK